ncbi:MAG: hypothetical protein H6719_03345 [Sandaracinaceae bacterium]|nr:hypothetical protein [Sandaracinaceae bacterium]
MPEPTTEADLAELAITVYVEELATDKRVLYVGDLESRGPERLAKVARSVELVTPRARMRGTRRGARVQSRRWPTDEDVGRWDVVIVPDLVAAGLGDESQIEQVGAWLADGGVLVAGSDGSERGLGYEALFDLLVESFDSVRMVGQAPFRGFSLVDFAPPGDLDVTFDGSLLEGAGERAQRFLALCGDDDVVLDAYAVVQIPSASIRSEAPAPRPAEAARVSELTERVREQQDALDAANVHAEELEHELESMREELDQSRRAAELRGAKNDEGRAELERRRAELDRRRAELDDRRAELDRKAAELSRARPAPPADDGRRRELEAKVAQLQAELSRSAAKPAEDAEYARLEAQLWESGRELTELRQEIARRAVLVRDLVEELVEARAHPAALVTEEDVPLPPAQPMEATLSWSGEELRVALQHQVAESVERAVAAEAEKAELQFRLDEVRSQLAVSEQARENDVEDLRRMEAALRGTVRGLNARLADVTELYQQVQARLAITEDDRRAQAEQNVELQRELGETRERLELEIARASTIREVSEQATTLRPAGGDAGPSAVEEELRAELARCREEATELALAERRAAGEAQVTRAAHLELEQRISGMRLGYEARIAEVVAELETTGSEAERAMVQTGELKSKVDILERNEAQLRGALMGTRLRLADREEAVSALLQMAAAHADGSTAPTLEPPPTTTEGPTPDEVEALRRELEEARSEAVTLRAQVEEAAREPAPVEAEPAPDLRNVLGARDALIARLQSELASSVERHRALDQEVAKATAALDAQRERTESARVEGAVGAEESVRELEELTDRLEQSELERRAALEALAGARAILAELADGLPEGGAPVGAVGAGDARGLRERLARLEAQAADREVLLRSLTAQLQERDDRIRALETFDAEDEDDPDALKAALLEMRERAQRLAEELDNEREARRRLED